MQQRERGTVGVGELLHGDFRQVFVDLGLIFRASLAKLFDVVFIARDILLLQQRGKCLPDGVGQG